MLIYYIRLVVLSLFFCTMMVVSSLTFMDSSTNVSSLCALVKELQQSNVLDGEVYIAQNNNVIMHEWSKDVGLCATNGKAQFLIGSISKQFTAVALLRILYTKSNGDTEFEKCEMVKNQLHKSLSYFLPAHHVVWNNLMPEWANEITLHHLLTHTAGITGSVKITFDKEGFDGVWNRLSVPHSVSEIIAVSAQEPLMFKPGTSYSYSNEGYLLLTEVVATLSGISFAQYIENLCNSVEMYDTRHPVYGTWKHIKQEHCHALVPEQVYNITNIECFLTEPALTMCHDISNACGAGGIVSTIEDLIKWNRALHKTDILLPKQLYALLIMPNLKDYGYGILNKNGILCHNGKIGSYSSDMLYIPENDLLIIILCNVDCDETIEKTACALDEVLKKVILNENERRQFVSKTLDDLIEKYPATRGAKRLMQFEIQLFDNKLQ